MKKKLPLRPNVCMLVMNQSGKLFLGERAGKTRGRWQFPQGGAEPKYTLRQNVYRELQEELGLSGASIGKVIKLKARHSYDWEKVPNYARGKWRGQSQTFWLVEFIGKDEEIDLSSDVEPELQNWKWCTPKQVIRLAEKKRVPGYIEPLREVEELTQAQKSKTIASKTRNKVPRPKSRIVSRRHH